MTMLLDERLRDLATQTHLLETKVSSLGWMAGAGPRTRKSKPGRVSSIGHRTTIGSHSKRRLNARVKSAVEKHWPF